MANAEHLAILKEGVEVWNKWREENKDMKPDLSNVELPWRAYLGFVNFRCANLMDANLCEVELSSADMSNANLRCADLRRANLRNANLSFSDLGGAQLRDSNLNNANFVNTKMDYTDLTGANLVNANLKNADIDSAGLQNANLSYANLNGAILSNVIFGATTFGFSDLSTCIGLDSVKVLYPCSIDFQTLRASRNLPKSFLLKIGLPELYIDYLPDFFQNEGIRYYPVFLSHSWANKPFARKLYEALIAKGVNVFFDEKKMKPGDDIFTGISRGIELYDKTILVCSEESLNSWWVDQELELVFEKERNLQKETGEKTGLLIPIRIDDHIDNWSNGKRMAIKQRVFGDFRNWQDDIAFENALNDLIHALNADRQEVKPVSYIRSK